MRNSKDLNVTSQLIYRLLKRAPSLEGVVRWSQLTQEKRGGG